MTAGRVFRRWPFVAVLGAAAMFASCGGSGDDGGTTTTTTSTGDAASPTATATLPLPTPAGIPGIAALEAMDYPDELTDGYFFGSPDAPLTLTMFEDFQCPYCLAFTLGHEPVIVEEYVLTGKVRLEFQNLPILGVESVNAAFVAECAAKEDLFWPLHRELFATQARAGQLSEEQLNVDRFAVGPLSDIAIGVGVDGAALTACISDPATRDALVAQSQRAATNGITGTPSFLLNGAPVRTPRDAAGWRELLDQ